MDVPKIIAVGEIIDSQGDWKSGNGFIFSSRQDGVVMTTPIGYSSKTFSGWKGLTDSYLGFRIKNENDTIYGWMNIKISDYYHIILLNAAYR
jgi:hypothetical protein